MPLVNRTSLRRYFVEDIEPNEWVDGDLWVDTSQTSPELFINDNGTAIGILNLSIDGISLTAAEVMTFG